MINRIIGSFWTAAKPAVGEAAQNATRVAEEAVETGAKNLGAKETLQATGSYLYKAAKSIYTGIKNLILNPIESLKTAFQVCKEACQALITKVRGLFGKGAAEGAEAATKEAAGGASETVEQVVKVQAAKAAGKPFAASAVAKGRIGLPRQGVKKATPLTEGERNALGLGPKPSPPSIPSDKLGHPPTSKPILLPGPTAEAAVSKTTQLALPPGPTTPALTEISAKTNTPLALSAGPATPALAGAEIKANMTTSGSSAAATARRKKLLTAGIPKPESSLSQVTGPNRGPKPKVNRRKQRVHDSHGAKASQTNWSGTQGSLHQQNRGGTT